MSRRPAQRPLFGLTSHGASAHLSVEADARIRSIPFPIAGRGVEICYGVAGSTTRKELDVTDLEKQKAEELISRLELSVGQVFPRDGGNAALLTTMIQTLNGLRSLLGLVRPH